MRTQSRLHHNIKCWRCGQKFPEGTHARKVGDSYYVDKYQNVRDHWAEKHLRTFKEEKA